MTEHTPPELRTLADVLEGFQTRTIAFEFHEVAEAARALAREYEAAGRSVTHEMKAEWIAFTLMGVAHDANGTRFETPPITDITAEVIGYWQNRAHAARHPLLRIRYADLVWEFGRRAKLKVAPEFPRIVIDATITAAEKKLFPHATDGFTAIRRALSLALSLKDEARVVAIRDALLAYEEAVSDDAFPGTWGVAFDELVATRSKAIPMPPELVATVISDIEARLDRLAHPKQADAVPDGFAVEHAALRLARYYRAISDQSATQRVLLVFGTAFRTAAAKAPPMLAIAWLERVLDTYRSFGLTKEAEQIEILLRELGPDAMKEMKPISHSTDISAEEIEKFLDAMTTGTLHDVLVRIAVQFIPKKAAIADQVHRQAREFPLTALFAKKLVDAEGRVTAHIGSVEDDLAGHITQQTSWNMQFATSWLHGAIARMRERFKPTAGDLCGHLLLSPVFDRGKAEIIERGLAAYLDGESIVAAHMLIPQVEGALRMLLRLCGGSTYKPQRRLGGLMLKNFDDLLREEAVLKSLGEDITQYFRVLFTDQRGWNIRNDVCHGITPLAGFSPQMTDRVFHALLVLALLRTADHRDA